MSDKSIWFWQQIVTPHMANLADALAAAGWPVVYVANEAMSTDRHLMGWSAPLLKHAVLRIAANAEEVTALAQTVPTNTIHICQGLRGNGLVGVAQGVLARRRLRHWVVMETLDDEGPRGLLKRVVYAWLFWRWSNRLKGILAIGWQTPGWVAALGFNRKTIFPFAYFLTDVTGPHAGKAAGHSPFRFLFVGQLIPRKRVDQLIQALAHCIEQGFELVVIGDGPMRQAWEAQASRFLPGKVRWLGRMSMSEIPREMANADCLVLPSRHDGWGAVVSEALMMGTPVVCSEACGSAGVVRESRVGGVVPAGDSGALSNVLNNVMVSGPIPDGERETLANWAKGLGARAGALYLSEILAYTNGDRARPAPPWERFGRVIQRVAE